MSAGLGRRADWWMRRCVRLLSLSLASTKPEGMDAEVVVSLACKASRSWAVCYNEPRCFASETKDTYFGTRRSTHIHHLEANSLGTRQRYEKGDIHTMWWGSTSRKRGGNMLTPSCREMFPWVMLVRKCGNGRKLRRTTSVSKTRKEWNFLNSGDLLRTFLGTLNCHARPSGYLGWMSIAHWSITRTIPRNLNRRGNLLALKNYVAQSGHMNVLNHRVESVCSSEENRYVKYQTRDINERTVGFQRLWMWWEDAVGGPPQTDSILHRERFSVLCSRRKIARSPCRFSRWDLCGRLWIHLFRCDRLFLSKASTWTDIRRLGRGEQTLGFAIL